MTARFWTPRPASKGGLVLSRRGLIGGLATIPIFGIVGCASKPPETPLAHLYGKEWVHGAFELYAHRYAGVQTASESKSHDVYRLLAQKGIVALDALQTRDVPFFIRVNADASSFSVERTVPERLTFTAGMTDADRKAATEQWNRAREHVHTDYEEIRRLNWAMTELLQQLQHIRNAIEQGQTEQYHLVEQLTELGGGGAVPFQLPYQVDQKDYTEILTLLLERLEDDKHRLERIEADIVSVGLTVRSTDAGSATMAASIRKVLLAVVEDSTATAPRNPNFPPTEDERQKLLADGRKLKETIAASPQFAKWQKDEKAKKFEGVGAFLAVLDQMTGLPTSAVYRTVLDVWRGEQDYLSYLKTVLSIVPHGGAVAKAIGDAIEMTDKARKIGGAAIATLNGGVPSADALAAKAKGVVLNTGSRFALDRVDKQLAFFKDQAEVQKVSDRLAQTDLMSKALPALPF